jgi:hypothetical protein
MTAQYNEGEIFRSTASIARDSSPRLTPSAANSVVH